MGTHSAFSAYPLFVQCYGEAGPMVVLLHGLGASSRLWRPTAELLAAEARLVCPDLLGFGRSPKPNFAYSPPSLGLPALRAAAID